MIKSYEKVSGEGTNLFHITVDASLKIDDIDWSLFDDLKKMAPFGIDNPVPVFVFENIILDRLEKFGKTQNHGKFIFKKQNGSEVQAIKFFIDDDKKIQALKAGDRITFTANLEKSIFGGKLELRLKFVDLF
jgi:single-stranded-DNA-specific exonuclease